MALVKICGTTSVRDAQLAQDAGADFLGIIVEHPPSPRSVDLETACAIAASVQLPVSAVTVNLPVEKLKAIYAALRKVNEDVRIQLHGDEAPEVAEHLAAAQIPLWAVVSGESDAVRTRAEAFRERGAAAILLDARETSASGIVYGGTGKVADWDLAREMVQSGYPVVLAGGLDPDNVARAIHAVQPLAVDVVSGVETRKGVKDPQKVAEFVRKAKTDR